MRSFLGRLAIACLVVVVIAAAGVLAGQSYEQHEFDKSRVVNISNGILTPTKPGKPANYLLIGSDSRTDESAQEVSHFGAQDTGGGSDVMMVLHVEPATKTGVLVSFPRDLVVDVPGHGRELLNATYNQGGPDLVIQTIEKDFDLKIHHYLEVGFRGFRDIVNAIGKIHLWFPTPVHDPYTGLEVLKSGCVSVNGDQALAYARSRHYYVPQDVKNPAPWQWTYPNAANGLKEGQGGAGWTATGSDLDRIPRQQYFLRTISQAAIDKTGSNPLKLTGLLDAVVKNFAHDQLLKIGALKSLIRTFNGLNPTRVQMTTLPNEGATGSWSGHVVAKYPDANLVLSRLRDLTLPTVKVPLPLPQRQVTLRVVNGSGIKGLGAKALQQFTDAGFQTKWEASDASRDDFTQSQIRVAPAKGIQGYTVALASGTNRVVDALTRRDTLDSDVLVIVGRDWDALTHNFHYTATARTTTTRPAGTTPTTTVAPVSTTSTTKPRVTVDTRFVPVNPKTGGSLVGCPPK
jgi:LCP family protein required for cell wall assembly